jgi:hypothetical protein
MNIDNSFVTKRLFNNTHERHLQVLLNLGKADQLSKAPEYVDAAIRRTTLDKAPRVRPYFEVREENVVLRMGSRDVAYIFNEEMVIDTSIEGAIEICVDSIDSMLHEVANHRFAIPYVEREVATRIFDELWEKFEKKNRRKAFQKEWDNGTGYFVVTALPEDRDYDSFSFVDKSGRKAMVLWDMTSQSRVIVFQRYSNDGMIAYNHSFGHNKGVSGSGAAHTTPYVLGLMSSYSRLASLND